MVSPNRRDRLFRIAHIVRDRSTDLPNNIGVAHIACFCILYAMCDYATLLKWAR